VFCSCILLPLIKLTLIVNEVSFVTIIFIAVVSSHMKQDADFDKRATESRRILNKYPDRVPVIVDRNPRAKNALPEIEKKKFLVPVC
jgi:hypothetical protein